jgi:hypothetical protein
VPFERLSAETLLRLAPDVRTRFDAAGHVLVDASLFSRPLALSEAIMFPAREFASIIRAAPMVSPSKPKRRVYIFRCVDDPGRWVVLRRESRFERVD